MTGTSITPGDMSEAKRPLVARREPCFGEPSRAFVCIPERNLTTLKRREVVRSVSSAGELRSCLIDVRRGAFVARSEAMILSTCSSCSLLVLTMAEKMSEFERRARWAWVAWSFSAVHKLPR